MRLRGLFAAPAVLLLLAGCSSGEDTTPGATETTTSTQAGNERGATEASVGQPVQRADGAYTITADSFVEPTGCDTYGEDKSPADTGERLVLASFTFESHDVPLTRSYLMPMDFYSVTDGTVKPTPNIGGEYQCEGGAEGRPALNQPLPNSRFVRTETFLVPIGAQQLGYRDPETRQAFEWDITQVQPAAPPPATEAPAATPTYEAEPTYTPEQPAYTAPAPAETTSSLEYNCSDAAWRESMGAEGDRLCGSTWQPYTQPPVPVTPDYGGGQSSGESQMQWGCQQGYIDPVTCQQYGY